MPDVAWWQRGAVYQIYPRSFADSDGDGIGDLRGIAAHARPPRRARRRGDLAVAVLPIADGRLRLRRLRLLRRRSRLRHAGGLRRAGRGLPRARHQRGDRLGAEPHAPTSTRGSRSRARAATSPKRDWYVWRDGARTAGRPTTGCRQFRGRRPRVDARRGARGQWYLHSFMAEQPDLNWDNPEVEAAMHDVLRFWMDRGVDGLRLDAIHKIAKDPLLRDHVGAARRHDEDWDTIHERLRGIRRVDRRVRRPDGRRRGRAAGPASRRRLPRLRRPAASRAQLRLRRPALGRRRLPRRRSTTSRRSPISAAWPAWFLANHDKSRAATRFDHAAWRARARASC